MTRIAEKKMNKVTGGNVLTELEKGLSYAFKDDPPRQFNPGDKVKVKAQPWLVGYVMEAVLEYDNVWAYYVLINTDYYVYHDKDLDWA